MPTQHIFRWYMICLERQGLFVVTPQYILDTRHRVCQLTNHAVVGVRHRSAIHYAELLSLYIDRGYAPQHPASLRSWITDSVSTWHSVDSAHPYTVSIGFDASKAVSSWGTLPLSPNVLYGHSVCMKHSAIGALTLLLQSQRSFELFDRFPTTQYWAGSYAASSSFTTRFQVGLQAHPRQLRFDCFRCSRREPITYTQPSGLRLDILPYTTPITHEARCIHELLPCAHPTLAAIHSIEWFDVRDPHSHKHLATLMLQKSLPQLTAANIFRHCWLFPARDADIANLLPALRVFERTSTIQVFSPHVDPECLPLEAVSPAIWIFTPRVLSSHLKAHIASAFNNILFKYSSAELDEALSRLIGASTST